MLIPDHDSLILTIQAKVQEAMDKRDRAVLEEAAGRHLISYNLLYRITRWRPTVAQDAPSFNLRKLLDAYDCACDVLDRGP